MNVASFVAGYRLGHDGKPPALSAPTLEGELRDVETKQVDEASVDPERAMHTIDDDHGWAWHLIGWTVGQAFAEHQLGKP